MKKQILTTVLMAALLAGCAHRDGRHGPRGGYGDPANPVISVGGGKITLDQEVLIFRTQPGQPLTVTWKIDAASGYRFTERGIVIEGRLTDEVVRGERPSVVLAPQNEIVNCRPADEARSTFTCTNNRSVRGIYKYSIRLTDGKAEIALDPPIVNW